MSAPSLIDQYFRFRCRKGLWRKGLTDQKRYTDQLDYEIGIICDMKFPGYFLIVSDILQWCEKNDIPIGPGRGSGAGSLCCYCLEITALDPIKYGLIFERFLNPARVSMPDIDLDFCEVKRHLVVEHLIEKFGKECVCGIGTFGTMKAKGAIKDVARALGYEYKVGDSLSKLVLPAISGKEQSLKVCYEKVPDLQRAKEGKFGHEYKNILDMAELFEGRLKTFGQHASGVIISNFNIWEIVALARNKKGNLPLSQLDMREVEDVGLIKFDILGLRALTTIDRCMKLIEERHNIKLKSEDLDVEDQETYDLLCSGDTLGVFQLGASQGIQSLTTQIQPRCLEDISMICAIYRPGPMFNRVDKQIIEVRNDIKEKEYLLPELEPILSETAGVIIYQEQAMQISRDLAGFSLAASDIMRKAIGHKISSLMQEQKSKFVSGMIINKFDKGKAEKLFEEIEAFADYSFNKCLLGNTMIRSQDGYLSINEIREQLTKGKKVILKSVDLSTLQEIDDQCLEVIDSGEQDFYEFQLNNGETIIATMNHKFLCQDLGFHTLYNIIDMDLTIISMDRIPSKILSTKYLGQFQGFNLRMKGKNHNYILENGWISKNSHSLCYAYIGFISAYLKTHYPIEFINSCLISEGDSPGEIYKYIAHCRHKGVRILPPDINKSESTFSISLEKNNEDCIRFGLGVIKNVGIKAMKEVAKERETGGPFTSLLNFCERTKSATLDRGTIQSLIFAGAFDSLHQNRSDTAGALEDIWRYKIEFKAYEKKRKTFTKRLEKFQEREKEIQQGERKSSLKRPTAPDLPKLPTTIVSLDQMSELDILQKEMELLGYYVSGHPVNLITGNKGRGLPTIEEIKNDSPRHNAKVKVLAVVSLLKETTTRKTKEKMAYLTIEDGSDIMETIIFAKTWTKIKKDITLGIPTIFTLSLEVITPNEDHLDENIVRGRIMQAEKVPVKTSINSSGSIAFSISLNNLEAEAKNIKKLLSSEKKKQQKNEKEVEFGIKLNNSIITLQAHTSKLDLLQRALVENK